MKLNRLLKSLLKTGLYLVEQATEHVDQVSDRAAHVVDQAKDAVYPKEDHYLRNVFSFAVGAGLGIGAGILLAPASGAELRSSIVETVKGRFSTKPRPVTGVETP